MAGYSRRRLTFSGYGGLQAMKDDLEPKGRAAVSQTAADANVSTDVELSDDDILEAMRRIPGYLDITTADFRAVYELAHAQAIDRFLERLRAADLMRADIQPLSPDLQLIDAARRFVAQDLKSLPVVDADGRVLAMLTETDVLRALGARSLLALLLQDVDREATALKRILHRPVAELMTTPVVTVPEAAGFRTIVDAFRRHSGRTMPVVDGQLRLTGLLLRKDFLAACHLGDLP